MLERSWGASCTNIYLSSWWMYRDGFLRHCLAAVGLCEHAPLYSLSEFIQAGRAYICLRKYIVTALTALPRHGGKSFPARRATLACCPKCSGSTPFKYTKTQRFLRPSGHTTKSVDLKSIFFELVQLCFIETPHLQKGSSGLLRCLCGKEKDLRLGACCRAYSEIFRFHVPLIWLGSAIHGPTPVQGETLEELPGRLVHTDFTRKRYGPMIGPYEFPPEISMDQWRSKFFESSSLDRYWSIEFSSLYGLPGKIGSEIFKTSVFWIRQCFIGTGISFCV